MTRFIFIGDIVGEAGLRYLETRLPELTLAHQPDFIVANAENIALNTRPGTHGGCGMAPDLLERLYAVGVDLITGGNHSWDGPHGHTIHSDTRILRPVNYGRVAPGRGAEIIIKRGVRLGVINVASRTALPAVDQPLDAIERQLAAWEGEYDLLLVDYHGEDVTEKLTMAYALEGRVTALLGTHTHVRTLDTQVLPGGTAYCTDVGMTGPSGGIQGYAPALFVQSTRNRLPGTETLQFASGPVELGAVLVETEGLRATHIERILA
jgi:metallophosphoesterase (TIGR00282 family)